jgi:hypothetical protein
VTVANDEKKIKLRGSSLINIFFKKQFNVLHVQNCSSNLLFINKISQELNCEIIFLSKNIFFQDQITENVTGEGFLENRLYILKEEKSIYSVKKEIVGTLWHKK